MRPVYRVLASFVLIILTLNLAQAVSWCGYLMGATSSASVQPSQKAAALNQAAKNCILSNTPIVSPDTPAIVAQLQSMASICNAAASDNSKSNQCTAAYACLTNNTTVVAGNQLNVCLQPNASNQTCAISTDMLYNTGTQSCSLSPFSILLAQLACQAKKGAYNATTNVCTVPVVCTAPNILNSSTNTCIPCAAPLVYSGGSCVPCPSGQTYLTDTSTCGIPAPVAAAPAPAPAPAAAPAAPLSTQAAGCAKTYGNGSATAAITFLQHDTARLSQSLSMGGSNFSSRMSAYNAESACCTALTGNATCN